MTVNRRFPYQTAFVACRGGCRADARCEYGCVACSLCVDVCRYDAISINALGVAEVDAEKCTACSACVDECPRELIRLRLKDEPVVVACANRDSGKNARLYCEVSCIGCGRCEKVCPSGAAEVKENLARIDESLCLSCGQCAVNCPRGTIRDLRGILTAEP